MPLYKDQQGNNFHLAGTTYNGGVIHQSPLHQTNNEAVCVAAQDPEVPTQIKGKGEGKLSHDKWTNEEQWGNAVTQFCSRLLQKVAKRSTEYRRYNDPFAIAF